MFSGTSHRAYLCGALEATLPAPACLLRRAALWPAVVQQHPGAAPMTAATAAASAAAAAAMAAGAPPPPQQQQPGSQQQQQQPGGPVGMMVPPGVVMQMQQAGPRPPMAMAGPPGAAGLGQGGWRGALGEIGSAALSLSPFQNLPDAWTVQCAMLPVTPSPDQPVNKQVPEPGGVSTCVFAMWCGVCRRGAAAEAVRAAGAAHGWPPAPTQGWCWRPHAQGPRTP